MELKEREVESNVECIVVKHTYRDEIKFLKVASPAKDAPDVYVNTTYELIADDLPLYEYKTSKSGGSFQRLNFVNMKWAIKLHAPRSGTIEEITVCAADFRKTFEAFHLKDGRLTPFSDKELADRRRARNEG